MEIARREEPEDTSDCPTVVYDPDGTLVSYANMTAAEAMDEILTAADWFIPTAEKARERHPTSSTENYLRDLWLREHGYA